MAIVAVCGFGKQMFRSAFSLLSALDRIGMCIWESAVAVTLLIQILLLLFKKCLIKLKIVTSRQARFHSFRYGVLVRQRDYFRQFSLAQLKSTQFKGRL